MTWVNYDDVIAQLQGGGLELDMSRFAVGTAQPIRCRESGGDREHRGWYWLNEILLDTKQPDGSVRSDMYIVGSFGIYRGNDPGKEKITLGKKGPTLTPEQKAAIAARQKENEKRARAMREAEAERAAQEAGRVWSQYVVDGESDYLQRKGVKSHGLRFSPSGNGTIAVPMLDDRNRVWGLQIIRGKSRQKNKLEKEYFPKGLQKKGHYFLIGSPSWLVLIAEGYATAATLFEATYGMNVAVVVAFDAGNLAPVAENIHKKYPKARILVCADDDYLTSGNPGVRAASEAALAVGGQHIKPAFTVDREGKKITDFNDLAALEGAHVVREQVEATLRVLKWSAPTGAGAGRVAQGGGEDGSLKPLLDVHEAVDRYSLIYGAGGTLFDHQEHELIPKSDVLDICVDHAWREWKLHVNRKVVRLREVGFDPTEKDKTIRCNMWAGWPTQAKHGECNWILELLQYLCSGEENGTDEIYKWVLKWLAYPLQNPGAKMRTALVFHGPQGAGKNLFFEAYAAIYGLYGRIIDQSAIDDKFNDWASKKLFMIADEVVARQELFHIKNKLKSLITGEWIRINPKNVAAHEERNHVNMVFLSNEKQPLVLEKDDRRYAVIYTPEKLPPEFYKSIGDEVANGGVEALYHYLLKLDLGDFNEHSKPPMTRSKRDLIEINLDSGERFIEEWTSGLLGLPVIPCASEDLYRAYQEYCKRTGVSRPRELPQIIGYIAKLRLWDKKRPEVYKDYHLNGEKMQISMVVPPEALVPDDKKQGVKKVSQWYTECYLDFREALHAEK